MSRVKTGLCQDQRLSGLDPSRKSASLVDTAYGGDKMRPGRLARLYGTPSWISASEKVLPITASPSRQLASPAIKKASGDS